MSPSEDAALLLEIVARHLRGLSLNLDEAYPEEEWGFAAQQAVEKLLKALVVMRNERPPLTHELRPLAELAATTLPQELLALQVYAVEARYRPGPFPLPRPRGELLAAIETLQQSVKESLSLVRSEEDLWGW
jgi:HEPN domain-containing protein